jgi:hypothetical protein
MDVLLGSLASFWRGLWFGGRALVGLDGAVVDKDLFVWDFGFGGFFGFAVVVLDEVVLLEGGCGWPHGGVASVMATSSGC